MCFKPDPEERLQARRDAEARRREVHLEGGPAARRRPPANQEVDREEQKRAEERLLTLLGH
jgi:hypothetical protein